LSLPANALEALRPFAAELRAIVDCGRDYIFLPKLKVRVNGQIQVLDGLLCPSEVHGYATRLFLSQVISGKGPNWKEYVIGGRTWYAPSWQGVEASLPLPQMLLAHLDAFA
jgi:hypothetical protein